MKNNKKLLLFLEHHFYYNSKNEIFCERIVDYKFLQRYLNVFEEVHICARAKYVDDNFKTKLRVDGKRIKLLPLPDFVGSIGILRNYLKCKKLIKKYIKNYENALLRGPSPISLIALDIIKKYKIKFAVEFVVNPKTAYANENKLKIFSYIAQKIFVKHAKELCLTANGVSYVTKYILQKEYPCKALLNPKSDKYFCSSYSTLDISEKEFYYNEQERNNKIFRLIHIGYMDKKTKGHLEVIEVAKQLLKKGYKLEVIFIGSGRLENYFKDYVEKLKLGNNFNFKGQLFTYKEIQNELKKADLFLFPSHSEGLPRVLIEAMGNSLPCISAPIDGIVELLDSEDLFQYSNIDGMVGRIEKYIENRELCKQIGIKNYNKALEYTKEKLESERTKFYLNLLLRGD